MTIKELFEQAENGTLTLEQFNTAAKEAKFVDLSEGNYVSKNKYTEDIQAKDTEIKGLKDTIATRDTDLTNLKMQLKDAGTDADKLTKLSGDLESLQSKYDSDTKALKDKLEQQAHEFTVREFANTKKFTSNAAKRDFVDYMLRQDLKFNKEGSSIENVEEFVKAYTAENDDAFVKETQVPKSSESNTNIPQFTAPTKTKSSDKLSLSEMMKLANEHPDKSFNF